MIRRFAFVLATAAMCGTAVFAARGPVTLPSGWRLAPPEGALALVGTMPQGMAISPDGTLLAVVESGVSPPALRILELPSLRQRAVITVPGAFGKPVWRDGTTIALAGANDDSLLAVDIANKTYVRTIKAAKGAWPAAVAFSADGKAAIADDLDGTVNLDGTAIAVGAHPADLVFSPGTGAFLYVSVRQTDTVAVIDTSTKKVVARIAVGRHPGALAADDGERLYVAESDDDSIGIINTKAQQRIGGIDVGLHAQRLRGFGASPNALLLKSPYLYAVLGAENAIARIDLRTNAVIGRIPAGWYPTGIAMGSDGTLYVSNGYGERAPANPQFDPAKHNSPGYVAEITSGSVRAIPNAAYARAARETASVLAAAAPQWQALPAGKTILHGGGPIKHVIYIIKENRTYDQVLGDIPGADGDARLTRFGAAVTPNLHAISRRFGVFDNAYANAQVSANGHNWTDAAFSNDFVERRWPPAYGGRLDAYDFQTGGSPDVPHNGYLWDAAKRAHITYRDYGEDIDFAAHGPKIGVNTFPGLTGHFDPAFVGWDLHTSDSARYAEWLREFNAFAAGNNLPQLEIVYLPNDHTSGTAPGMPSPRAYLATNDYAVGRLVDRVSHSKYWRSTAVFVLEDDAQNGPDHVSDQRSTFYIASAYARGGVQHAHYSTASFVHTIEMLLGLPPLSIYDQTAQPLYAAFATAAVNAAPYNARVPSNMNEINSAAAYGAARSAKLDFSHADAADEKVLNDILMGAPATQP